MRNDQATGEQMATANKTTRMVATATKMLCTEAQYAAAVKLLAETGMDHAVIDVANKKGSYQKIVSHTEHEMRYHGQKGAVTLLASTKYGRVLSV